MPIGNGNFINELLTVSVCCPSRKGYMPIGNGNHNYFRLNVSCIFVPKGIHADRQWEH